MLNLNKEFIIPINYTVRYLSLNLIINKVDKIYYVFYDQIDNNAYFQVWSQIQNQIVNNSNVKLK